MISPNSHFYWSLMAGARSALTCPDVGERALRFVKMQQALEFSVGQKIIVDDLSELAREDPSMKVEVVQVNPSPSPSQQRLLCRLTILANAPRPHRGARFERRSKSARPSES